MAPITVRPMILKVPSPERLCGDSNLGHVLQTRGAYRAKQRYRTQRLVIGTERRNRDHVPYLTQM